MSTFQKSPLNLIVPCRDEASNLANLIDDVERNAHVFSRSCQLILVDDGSCDDTWRCLRDTLEQRPAMKIGVVGLQLIGPLGKHIAQAVALDQIASTPGLLGFMDADGEHRAADMFAMADKTENKGISTVAKRLGYSRGFINSVFTVLFSFFRWLLIGQSRDAYVTDFMVLTEGDRHRVLHAPGLGLWPLDSIALVLKLRMQSVPIVITRLSRPDRSSRWSFTSLFNKGLTQIVVHASVLVPRLAVLLGFLTAGLLVYGFAVGLNSVREGTFLGIGSVLVTLVALFIAAFIALFGIFYSVVLTLQQLLLTGRPCFKNLILSEINVSSIS